MTDAFLQNFLVRLKTHLHRRLLPGVEEVDISNIVLDWDRMFSHLTMRVNYTTYDLRRDSQLVTIKRSPDIMLTNLDDEESGSGDPHSFQYARVVGIYHAMVSVITNSRLGPKQRVEFLHVRYFEKDRSWASGWKKRRLDRISFVPGNGEDAFGFIDPLEVIRTCYLLPAGSQGKTSELLSPSPMARKFGAEDHDWSAFYVNRCV
jgi:hypothetical protein